MYSCVHKWINVNTTALQMDVFKYDFGGLITFVVTAVMMNPSLVHFQGLEDLMNAQTGCQKLMKVLTPLHN